MRASRWITLFAVTRAAGTIVAVLLLVVHRVTAHDLPLAAVTLAYGAASIGAFVLLAGLQRWPIAWAADTAVTLAFILAAAEWRSPFYIMALTALILPATTLTLRGAMAWGGGFTLAYLAIAISSGIDWTTLETTTRLESLSTHLMVPMLVVLALAYAAQLLGRLEAEQERSGRMAIEAERRRIAWELHDSAKQRVHAAHLILSALRERVDTDSCVPIDQAVRELRAATTDMETSLCELRSPLLEGRRLAAALRERAAELAPACSAAIHVHGRAAELPPFIAAHAYRIASEALANAVRHADARGVDVHVRHGSDRLEILVIDDGRGIQPAAGRESTGLSSMRERARAIGGELAVTHAEDGRGTEVRLRVPLTAI